MTGLVAILGGPSAPVDAKKVEALAGDFEALHGEAPRHAAPSSPRVGAIGLGTAPVVDGGGAWALVVGRAYGSKSPRSPLDALDGQFALVRDDPAAGAATVAADPFAMQALHVAERDGLTYVSTSALALARHLRLPADPLGVRSYLRSGYQFGALTAFSGVRRLEPATALRLTGTGRPLVETYWAPAVDSEIRAADLRGTVERCTAALVDALAARLSDRSCLWTDLTGGFDSRLLALAMREAGVTFRATTTGPAGSADVRLARRLAEMAGWEWSNLRRPADWEALLAEWLEPALAWGGATLDVLQLAEVLWGHEQNARTCPALINGGGGEHLRHYASAQEFLAVGRSTEVNFDRWIDLRMIGPEDVSVFVEDPTPLVREDFMSRMRERARPYADQPNSTQLDLLYAYKSMGHFGAYCSAARGALEFEMPFYWRPVFTAAISARDRFRTQHRLMRHMIHGLDPAMAALMTERGGPADPLRPGNVHRFAPYYGRQVRNLASRLSRRAVGRDLTRPAARPAPIDAARAAVVRALRDRGALRAPTMRSGALYRPEALDALADASGRPGFDRWPQLGRIITVELALEATGASL